MLSVCVWRLHEGVLLVPASSGSVLNSVWFGVEVRFVPSEPAVCSVGMNVNYY